MDENCVVEPQNKRRKLDENGLFTADAEEEKTSENMQIEKESPKKKIKIGRTLIQTEAISAHNDFVYKWNFNANMEIAANRSFIKKLNAQKWDNQRKKYGCTWSHHDLSIMHSNLRCRTYPEPEEQSSHAVKKVKTIVRFGKKVRTVETLSLLLPKLPIHPNSVMWTAILRNYKVDDEPVLRYIPYFGDEDTEDVVSDVYELKNTGQSAAEADFEKALAKYVLTWVLGKVDVNFDNLPEIEKSVDISSGVLQKVLKLLKNPGDARDSSATKLSGGETSNSNNISVTVNDNEENFHSEAYLKLVKPYRYKVMDSYKSLMCRRCYVYDCDTHGCVSSISLDIQEQNALNRLSMEFQKESAMKPLCSRTCGDFCHANDLETRKDIDEKRKPFEWDDKSMAVCARAFLIFAGDFCRMAKVLGNNISCTEVAKLCKVNNLSPATLQQKIQNHFESQLRLRKKNGKRKSKLNSYQLRNTSAFNIFKMEITRSTYNNKPEEDHQMLSSLDPCSHIGGCEPGVCGCTDENQFCSKFCNCSHDACRNLFGGCRCLKGRCRTKACPCYAANRECDPDICVVCCNTDELLRNIAHDEVVEDELKTSQKELPTSCQNRNLTLSLHKKICLSYSSIPEAGWGLYLTEFVAKDEFIQEYSGELISQIEADRRGSVYDKLNQSYLFNLDNKFVVDANRKGNKTRFANHSKNPNCYTRIVNVNGDNRIGLYALKDIKPNTELFFDYMYEHKVQHPELIKNAACPGWMKDSSMAGKISGSKK